MSFDQGREVADPATDIRDGQAVSKAMSAKNLALMAPGHLCLGSKDGNEAFILHKRLTRIEG
ncbi:hypothetical protein D3C71_1066300 [compost metagenome]